VDAVETLTARSPDGRTWEIGATREHLTFAQNRDEPGFWAGVVVTGILLVLTIVFAWISTTVAILAGIVLGIWVLERISNLLRPRLYARTEGPPRDEVVWKANRFARGQLERRIVEAIERGNPDVEPPGLTLLQD
jgi:hypothetical protein